MSYEIFQFGDQIALDIKCSTKDILKEIEPFHESWSQYNEFKPEIPRQGLCIINEKGKVGPGPALSSIPAWNDYYGTSYYETDFDKPTEVYHSSPSIQKLMKDCLDFSTRTHFIKLLPGGYFPPHRDNRKKELLCFRLIVPIKNVNPPDCRFMIEDKTLHWEPGRMYAVNTTLEHTLMNYSNRDSIWIVINAIVCDKSIDFVTKNLLIT